MYYILLFTGCVISASMCAKAGPVETFPTYLECVYEGQNNEDLAFATFVSSIVNYNKGHTKKPLVVKGPQDMSITFECVKRGG